MKVIEHVWFKCPKPCPDVERGDRCHFCDGGLSQCVVCGAFEGQLLTACPGYLLNYDAREACYSGNVYDFVQLREWKRMGYDIRKKRWTR